MYDLILTDILIMSAKTLFLQKVTFACLFGGRNSGAVTMVYGTGFSLHQESLTLNYESMRIESSTYSVPHG